MKKYILTILTSIFLIGPVFASNIEILPTLQSKTNVQDRVWVGTFQIVWNNFINKIAFNEVKFPSGTPQIVNDLNKQSFTEENLSSKSYYTYSGRVKKNTAKSIAKDIKNRFGETSDIINKLNLAPSKDKYLVYAMLKKDFTFKSEFDKLGFLNFKDTPTEFFGINNNSKKELRSVVDVLFYNNPNDFAVKLNTKDNDEVYLYKTSNTKPFNYIYQDMLKKQISYIGDKKFNNVDLLMVPNLKFFEEKSFDEVCGKRIKGTNIAIEKAIETVKFEMNNKGVKLKSEAGMVAMVTSLSPEDVKEPRCFNFNDTFIVFIKEKDKTVPYFALRVFDIRNFQ